LAKSKHQFIAEIRGAVILDVAPSKTKATEKQCFYDVALQIRIEEMSILE